VRLAPLGFSVYGGLGALQALWADPWLTRVHGLTGLQAVEGPFAVNMSMLLAFPAWGAVMPRLERGGVGVMRLMTWGLPLPLELHALDVALGADAGAGAAPCALWCVAWTFVAVSQPAVGADFPAAQAGRALSVFSSVIFAGVFCIRWGTGLAIDLGASAGLDEAAALCAAFTAFDACALAAYPWSLQRHGSDGRAGVDNRAAART